MVWNQSGAVGEHVVRGLDIVIGNVLNVWIITRQEEKAEEEEVYGAGSAFFIANDGGGGGGRGGGCENNMSVDVQSCGNAQQVDQVLAQVSRGCGRCYSGSECERWCCCPSGGGVRRTSGLSEFPSVLHE